MVKITFWVKVKGRKRLVKKTFEGDNEFSSREALELLKKELKDKEFEVEAVEVGYIEDPWIPSEMEKRKNG